MNAGPDVVVLVHGVSSEGKWYAKARAALEPHFACRAIRYREYEKHGKLKAILSPTPAVSGGIVGLIWGSVWALSLGTWLPRVVVLGGAVFLTGIPAGAIGAWRLRRKTAARVVEQFDSATFPGKRTHVVAHSFGTYLSGVMLRRFNREFGCVCLAGSVLRRRFPWSDLIKRPRPAVEAVRNDVARRDRVALGGGMLPYLGSSGTRGFVGPADVIHSPKVSPCSECVDGHVAAVHNIEFDFEHSDHFVGRGHLEGQYLPFLFRVDPAEYAEFVGWCRAGAAALRLQDHVALRAIETADRGWEWASGTLEQHIACQIHARSKGRPLVKIDPQQIALAVTRVWMIVDAACAARGDPTRDHAVIAMRPRIAVVRALGDDP